ncbi:hypothetical protein [Streptomyces sp. NPDC007205]|uniref:hypothetical protein n=1 Tax=Streptomyces sp. NPDC007205 TaxID=3154316 RepID=UPI0033DFFDE6
MPLTLLPLAAGFFCRAALVTRPSGTSDHDAYAAVVLSCLLTLAAAAAVLGLRLLGRRRCPTRRRFISRAAETDRWLSRSAG